MEGSALEHAPTVWFVLGTATIGAAAVALAIARVARDVARRFDLLDRPNHRSSHVSPTPRLGGLGFIGAIGLGVGAVRWGGLLPPADAERLLIVAAVAVGIALVSLFDDLRGLPSAVRLATHVAGAVAMVVLLGGASAGPLPWGGLLPLGVLGVPITIFWITFFTNAFNFMDGIDGIAGIQAAIAGLAWMAIGAALSEPAVAYGGALVAGAAAGFLWLNWPPATIFMGDVGSALLGSLLAALPLTARRPTALFYAAALIVAPFVFDAAFTLARRATRGENIFQAHRSHLYQRLTAAGWSAARVDRLYAAIAVAGGAAAFLHATAAPGAGAAAGVVAAALVGLWLLVVQAERRTKPAGAGELGSRNLA
jgi:UDP-N-acetylmuramyl pentapeptide phosphotransferase/UDP-N-acetylglucosamine-1-phosphate transferase